jgi:hypothetical protein
MKIGQAVQKLKWGHRVYYLSLKKKKWYITNTILDIIHLLFKTQLSSIGLSVSVPHRKHILDIIHRPVFYLKLTQLYRFVRTSQETHSGHYPSSCLLFNT